MKQYLELLETVKTKGIHKPAARAGMPGTTSLFGYQFRHDLADGFPLLTTKKVSFKNIMTELLWFLRGDTNIAYLVAYGCHIWDGDAYNYYRKFAVKNGGADMNAILKKNDDGSYRMHTKEEFIEDIVWFVEHEVELPEWEEEDYTFGDCGFQYGKVWRDWEGPHILGDKFKGQGTRYVSGQIRVDQIKNLVNGLLENPGSRRHILTSIDPAHDKDLALYWCHALTQFNCRPISYSEKWEIYNQSLAGTNVIPNNEDFDMFWEGRPAKYYLDCQMYQRSADLILGVPYNIASYAALTHILADICNMIPGEMVYTYGDVHIYDNHMEAVNEQIVREPRLLPIFKWKLSPENKKWVNRPDHFTWEDLIMASDYDLFEVEGYDPHPAIKAKLSTGV